MVMKMNSQIHARLILPLDLYGQRGKMHRASYNDVFRLNGNEIYTIKKKYKERILDQLMKVEPITEPMIFIFIFYRKSKLPFDLDNWGFCQAKLLFDSMQNKKGTLKNLNKNYIPFMPVLLPDDNTKYIRKVVFEVAKEELYDDECCECLIYKWSESNER